MCSDCWNGHSLSISGAKIIRFFQWRMGNRHKKSDQKWSLNGREKLRKCTDSQTVNLWSILVGKFL